MQGIGARLLTGYLWLVLLFLYVPILVMAAMGFNASPLYALPFDFDLSGTRRWPATPS